MKQLVHIFDELKSTSSTNEKESILKKHEGNNELKEVLQFVYDPMITTGISNKKISKNVKEDYERDGFPVSILEVIDYLAQYNSGRDKDILNMKRFLGVLETDDEKTYAKQIITKSLKLGVTAKTINKVYGEGFIAMFEPMLAESFSKHEKKIKGKFYVTLKLDGNRTVVIKDNHGNVKFYTRKGKEIDGMEELIDSFSALPNGFVYDGETLIKNKGDKSVTEIFQETQSTMRKKGKKENIEFYMFDMLPLNEFKKGKSTKTYEQRRNSMSMLKIKKDGLVKILDVLYEGEDKEKVISIMKEVEELGFEGVMVNAANGLYEGKRTASIQKAKTMKSADVLVLSLEKSTHGQFAGMTRRVNILFKDSIVGCGSGFTPAQRQYYAENPDEIVGKIVEILYFEETKDKKTGELSLRFPVFKCVRDDKGVEDVSYE